MIPSDHFWHPGDVILYRGVGLSKIWFAIPARIVSDTPDLIAVYWQAGTRTKMRKMPSGVRFTPMEVLHASIPMLDSVWLRTNVLVLITPGEAHAVYAMWDAETRAHLCWYCNLQDPIRRTAIGFDTSDQWLDVVFNPDRSGWHWKDADELESAVLAGACTAEQARSIQAEGERVIQAFEENQPPFCDGWERWSPPDEWQPLEVPEHWDLGF